MRQTDTWKMEISGFYSYFECVLTNAVPKIWQIGKTFCNFRLLRKLAFCLLNSPQVVRNTPLGTTSQWIKTWYVAGFYRLFPCKLRISEIWGEKGWTGYLHYSSTNSLTKNSLFMQRYANFGGIPLLPAMRLNQHAFALCSVMVLFTHIAMLAQV